MRSFMIVIDLNSEAIGTAPDPWRGYPGCLTDLSALRYSAWDHASGITESGDRSNGFTCSGRRPVGVATLLAHSKSFRASSLSPTNA